MAKTKKLQKKLGIKLQLQVQRDSELKQYGRQLSLRPSIVHKSRKKYSRRQKHSPGFDAEGG